MRVRVTSGHEAWFVLDTGATGTTIHAGLAQPARVCHASGETSPDDTVEATARVATVRLEAFAIVGLPVTHELDVAVHDMALVRRSVPDAEGIVGQDVLARYDYLIDTTTRPADHRPLRARRSSGVHLPLACERRPARSC